jgi:hypothetical protein
VNENLEKDDHIMEHRFANRIIKAMVKADSSETENDKGKLIREKKMLGKLSHEILIFYL